VVTDQAAGTAGMKLVEGPEPQAARLASLSGASPEVAADAPTTRRIDAGQVRRVVGAEFPLADAIRAYQAKPLRGKVVLRVDGDG